MTRTPLLLFRIASKALLVLIPAVLAATSAPAAECTEPNLFEPPIVQTTGPTPLFIATGDFNEDGIIDLAVTNSGFFEDGAGGSVAVLIGLGNRSYAFPTHYPMAFPFGIVAGDFDEDGITDLAVASRAGHVAILRGQGAGGVGNGAFALNHTAPAGDSPYQILAEDFDDDGILDLAVALNGTAAVSVLRGLGGGGVGNGTFAPGVEFPLANLSVGIESGDFNEDGIPDLVATEYQDGTVGVLLGTGSPTLGASSFATALHFAAGPEPWDIAVADFDEDGHADLAVTNAAFGGTAILSGNGDGSFDSSLLLPSGSTAVVVPVDVNQDDILDLIIGSAGGAKAVLYYPGLGNGGMGNGTFGLPTTYGVGSDPFQIVVDDFDDDGFLDLFSTRYLSGSILMLPGTCGSAPVAPRAPVLTAVRDVPNDEGGEVFVTWLRSPLDVPGLSEITSYRVWRRIHPATARARMSEAHGQIERDLPVQEMRWVSPDGSESVTYWEALIDLPAEQNEGYGYTAPTTQDSMKNNNPYTAFYVSALTSDPFVFYKSDVDSGYSVDNIKPKKPKRFAGDYATREVILTWEPNEELDFEVYLLFRGDYLAFEPSAVNQIAELDEPGYVDASGSGIDVYKLAAMDEHGNMSDYAVAWTPGAVSVGKPSVELTLRGAVPNPSRGGLMVFFTLPASSPGTLQLIDLNGRLVRTMDVASLGPGAHQLDMARGADPPTGVYWIRLSHSGMSRVMKAVLLD